jgi:hypothetical protein
MSLFKKSRKARNQYRQGDVFLIPVKFGENDDVEKVFAEQLRTKRVRTRYDHTVALGEVTGHSHVVLDGDVYVGDGGELFVRATEKTILRHQEESGKVAEHKDVKPAPGIYRVRIQREYDPRERERKVVD